MDDKLKNCWVIMSCGREKGGKKVQEFGECVASKENLGHSCWMIAGTLCGGEVQGSAAQKERNCVQCEVYKLYNRFFGSQGKKIKEEFPEEEEKYGKILMDRSRNKKK